MLVCVLSECIVDVCSGIVGEKLLMMCWFGSVYSGIVLWLLLFFGCSIGVDGVGMNGGFSMCVGSSWLVLMICLLCELFYNV